MKKRIFQDPRTGREVWQMTDGDFECVAPYMDKRAWSRDDRHIFYMSNRTGSWQPFRLNVETGEERPLCEVEGALYRSLAYDPAHNEVFVQNRGGLIAVEADTLRARQAVDGSVLRLGTGGKGAAAALSGDGTLCVFAGSAEDGHPAVLVVSTDGRNRIRTVRCERDDIRPGHELFCPADNNIVSFHGYPDRQNNPDETPAHRAAQWRMDLDTGAMRPLVLMPAGFRATHCLWGPSGDRFYFHRKTVPQWVTTALGAVDRAGADERIYFETTAHRLGHSAPSPDEKWIVTDSQDTPENMVMLVHTERDEQRLLCWANASIKKPSMAGRLPNLPPHTDTDVHPGFSSTGRYVHFTSDVTGRSQVYVVPVADLTGA